MRINNNNKINFKCTESLHPISTRLRESAVHKINNYTWCTWRLCLLKATATHKSQDRKRKWGRRLKRSENTGRATQRADLKDTAYNCSRCNRDCHSHVGFLILSRCCSATWTVQSMKSIVFKSWQIPTTTTTSKSMSILPLILTTQQQQATTTDLILQGTNMAHECVDLVLVLFHLPMHDVFLIRWQLVPFWWRHLQSVGGALRIMENTWLKKTMEMSVLSDNFSVIPASVQQIIVCSKECEKAGHMQICSDTLWV